VAHISEFDSAAKEKGLSLLSGLSTYPVLTAAALKDLSREMEEITDVRAGIAPSPKAVMGRNVIAAVAAYSGKQQVGVMRDGAFTKVHGLTETHRQTICVPGEKPLPNILFSSPSFRRATKYLDERGAAPRIFASNADWISASSET